MALTPNSFSIILLFILPIFLIMEASAGENFISAATTSNEDQIVPFNQLIEHSFNKNYKGYNELAKAHNVGSYLGKNASFLNSEHPFLNSHNLIHQVFLASKTISPNTVVSTDAYTKYEVAYLSKNQLTMPEVLELLNKFHAPIIYLNLDKNWVIACTDFPTLLEPLLLTSNNQFVLNNYSQNLDIFPKTSTGLQTMRLGDISVFNKLTLDVGVSAEFKTSHNIINPLEVNTVFDNKFKKAPFTDHQLLDFNKRIIYHRTANNSIVQAYDLNNFKFDNITLTEKFKLGRNIATQRPFQATLQFNSVSSALNKFLKR